MVSLVDGTYPTSLLQTVQQFREREPKLTLFCFCFRSLLLSCNSHIYNLALTDNLNHLVLHLSRSRHSFAPPPFRFCLKKPLGNYLRSRALTVPGSGRRRWLTLRLYPSLFFFYRGVFGSNSIDFERQSPTPKVLNFRGRQYLSACAVFYTRRENYLTKRQFKRNNRKAKKKNEFDADDRCFRCGVDDGPPVSRHGQRARKRQQMVVSANTFT